MRGGLVDDAGQCAKLLRAGGYSRVVQGIGHLGFLFRVGLHGSESARANPDIVPWLPMALPSAILRLLAKCLPLAMGDVVGTKSRNRRERARLSCRSAPQCPSASQPTGDILAEFRTSLARIALARVLAEHDPAAVAGRGECRERSLRANPDLSCAGRAAQLLDAVGVHGRPGAPVPQIAAARAERVRPLDPDIAGVEREGVAAFDAVPLEGLQEELRHGCIAVVGIEYVDVLG